MFKDELPIQCQTCLNLHCYGVRMSGNNDYSCNAVPFFLKKKEDKCPRYIFEEGYSYTGRKLD